MSYIRDKRRKELRRKNKSCVKLLKKVAFQKGYDITDEMARTILNETERLPDG
jgi:hypothetical protein